MPEPAPAADPRQRWATRIGLILAMAGLAVGLGNFLRFPVQATQNGGGTFMIPYFISFLLLGIPLMWIEWGIGRFGGRHGHGSTPGAFDALTGRRTRWAKYLGVGGLAVPMILFVYYTYVVSWMLGLACLSLTGDYFGLDSVGEMRGYLASYQNVWDSSHAGPLPTVFFFAITFAFLGWTLARGLSRGIERVALVGMPLLFVFAFILMIRVLTLPPAVASPADGLNFIWSPQWSALADARVWLAAAGQVFFTLSIGVGTIHTYASYVRPHDDIALTGLSTAATNEFAEVVLGGTIAIPAAVVFFGVAGATAIAQGGAYDLGIVAMGVVFQSLPGPELWGRLSAFLWFFLLFIAGITSSVAMATPALAFLEEELGISRRRAVAGTVGAALLLALFPVLFYQRGVLGELDYWAGTFGLVVFATIEVFLFAFAFGMDRGWRELHAGADLRIARPYRWIMKWITPLFLSILLVWWGTADAIPTLLMQRVADPADLPYLWASRLLIAGVFGAFILMIRRAWRRRPARDGWPEETP